MCLYFYYWCLCVHLELRHFSALMINIKQTNTTIYYEDYKDEFYDEDDAWDDFEDNEGWEDY